MVAPTLSDKRDEILRIAAAHGAGRIRVFGSMARGEEREDSDLDLLVEFQPGRSLLDHAALELDLQQLLGRPVQIGTPNGLREPWRERILAEAIPL